MARRELRVVGGHRAGADDDRVAQRAQAVQVHDVLVAGDELRVAGMGGDEAVEALSRWPTVIGRVDVAEQTGRYRFNSSARASFGASSDRHPPPGDHARTASASSGFTGSARTDRPGRT